MDKSEKAIIGTAHITTTAGQSCKVAVREGGLSDAVPLRLAPDELMSVRFVATPAMKAHNRALRRRLGRK